jgi:hypothetical protein
MINVDVKVKANKAVYVAAVISLRFELVPAYKASAGADVRYTL